MAQALVLGGHVCVDVKDNVYLEPGVLAKANAELVEKAVKLLRLLGCELASPDEARQQLRLGNRRGAPATAA